MRKVTRPLRELFDVEYFIYHRIRADGNYVAILDRPDWAENYLSAGIQAHDPYLRHPSVYQNGICCIANNGGQEFINQVTELAQVEFGMDFGIVLIQGNKDCVEFASCASRLGSRRILELSMNGEGLLGSFTRYLKNELNKEILEMEEQSCSLPLLKGQDFFNPEMVQARPKHNTCEEFLKTVGREDLVLAYQSLSLRERDCVKGLLEHYTAKDLAKALGLSPRTTQFYLENIKNKLNVWRKSEVLMIARELRKVGLL